MTRSEKLEKAIINTRNAIFLQHHGDREFPEIQEVRQFTLDLLLAEQKRREGCDLCLFDDGTKVTHLVLAETCEGDANYCPHCGRDLTEGESE